MAPERLYDFFYGIGPIVNILSGKAPLRPLPERGKLELVFEEINSRAKGVNLLSGYVAGVYQKPHITESKADEAAMNFTCAISDMGLVSETGLVDPVDRDLISVICSPDMGLDKKGFTLDYLIAWDSLERIKMFSQDAPNFALKDVASLLAIHPKTTLFVARIEETKKASERLKLINEMEKEFYELEKIIKTYGASRMEWYNLIRLRLETLKFRRSK